MLKADYDIAIIGAGLLGCFTARNLSRYNWRVAVFEKNCDVCTEMSKANTAIIYPGYDPVPGSLKARLSVEAVRDFDRLCKTLGVRYSRPGSLMVSFGARGNAVIKEKYDQGMANGADGLRLLSARETISIEPKINRAVSGALYAPTTATVNPWELGIAGAVNAADNGADFYFNNKVGNIERIDGGYRLSAVSRTYTARAVVNCAGLFGDEVNELVNRPRFRLETSAADYLLLDESAGGHVRHIIMHEPESKGRGATLVPTVNGNILLGPSHIKTDSKTSFETTREGCEFVSETSKYVFPELPLHAVIRSFATLRPSISIVEPDEAGGVRHTGERINDLFIYEAENPGFINLAGIKTPGLTCCDGIGRYVSEMLLDILGNPGRNTEFSESVERPVRFRELDFDGRAALVRENHEYGKIVCRCRHITEAEIRQSIRQALGATTVDGVKRRAGALMGRCQGGFCTQRIIEILAEELDIPKSAVRKDGAGTELVRQA